MRMSTKTKAGERKESLSVEFLEIQTSLNVPPRCVDGRHDRSSKKGPQMLGGSLLPLLLAAIDRKRPFDDAAIQEYAQRLQGQNLPLGVHYGSHRHEGASDCGFADRMNDILRVIKTQKDELLNRVFYLLQEGAIDRSVAEAVDYAYQRFYGYTLDHIRVTGDALIALLEHQGASVEHLEGDHAERVVFVNLKPGTTLDTNGMNDRGVQAFNLDLWAVQKHAKELGIEDEQFIAGASLLLYMATEIVLVEQKGKSKLPIHIHS